MKALARIHPSTPERHEAAIASTRQRIGVFAEAGVIILRDRARRARDSVETAIVRSASSALWPFLSGWFFGVACTFAVLTWAAGWWS